MCRLSTIGLASLFVCSTGSLTSGADPAETSATAADDAAYALKVFESDLNRIKELAKRGPVAADDVEMYEVRVLQARTEAAIARGDKSAQVELLKREIGRLRSRLSRVQQLRLAGVVSDNDVAGARAAVEETEIKLANIEGDRTRLVELLEAKVSYRSSQSQRILLLRQENVIGDTDVALELLNLANAKNELAAARAEAP